MGGIVQVFTKVQMEDPEDYHTAQSIGCLCNKSPEYKYNAKFAVPHTDAVGGKTKPWGVLPKRKVWIIALSALGIAFSIGIYFAFLDASWLFPIGIIEGFFLFAYNLESASRRQPAFPRSRHSCSGPTGR